MMTVKVLLFASARDLVGTGALEIDLAAGACAGDIYAHPRLAVLVPRRGDMRLAVNEEFAEDGAPVKSGDTVAVLPPVCGG